MTTDRTRDYLVGLVREFCKLPKETEWVEFKVNNVNPEVIGESLSALVNAAALAGKANAYLLWGIRDEDHEIIGTSFKPNEVKIGNEELESWLLKLLTPKIHFRFYEIHVDEKPVVILELEVALRHPVQFRRQEFIRIGSYKKPLKDFPEKERALWRVIDAVPFELAITAEHIRDEDVVQLLDYPAYFDLLKRPLPDNRDGILKALKADRIISNCDAGGWNITNCGAVLFAKKLDDFNSLSRKSMRVIQYKGTGRTNTIKEQAGAKGYASGFEGLIEYINNLLPSNEVINQALRTKVAMFPELAVRELVANALAHQDFFMMGVGPMIEIFDDRIEITNPGEPLVDPRRLVDSPPRSRNELMTSIMRRIGICEERGSGWDKVVFQTELYQLPAPLAEVSEGHMRVILFAQQPLTKMDKADRVRAIYLHACLRFVNRTYVTNTSVRERFGIAPHNTASASRLIREALTAGVIIPFDSKAPPKLRCYQPYWASVEN